MRLGAVFVWAVVVTCFGVQSGHAEKRVALVIGNSVYSNVPRLDNPANDAKLLADTLSALGFTLVGGGAQLDLDKSSLDRAVQSFGAQLVGADVGLFYYAGHGVQVRGENYLIPVDANPTKEADVDFQMLDTNLVLRQMEGAGTRLNIVILDACRNNPFGGRGLAVGRARDPESTRMRDTGGGLAQMQAPEGTLISFATQPGSVAQDGIGGNSPYARALALEMRRPGLDIFQAFNQVGLAVKRATGGVQQPWVSSSPIDGAFYFVSPSPSLPTADTRRFDGLWLGSLVCEATSRLPGWKSQLVGRVTNGLFHAQRGSDGAPRSETFDGMINLDGSAEISQRGFSGETKTDPFRRPTGTQFSATYVGSFDISHGAFTRLDRASCNINFDKRDQNPSTVTSSPPVPPPDQSRVASTTLSSAAPGVGPQADGLFSEQDMQRVNAIAIEDALSVMPRFKIERADPQLPAGLRKFVGIWASDVGFNSGHARHAMLIVTDVEAPAQANGYWVTGSPTAHEAKANNSPGGVFPFEGKITGDKLTCSPGMMEFSETATLTSGGNLSVVHQSKTGKLSYITLKPVWRLLEAERSAKR
jgi:Caspase domain